MDTTIPQITADEGKQILDAKESVVFLDVRTPGEYGRGNIEGSINVPVDDVGKTIEAVLPDKTKKIIAYCLSGSRSDIAVSVMKSLGYANVFSMTSGLLAWRAKKFPLV